MFPLKMSTKKNWECMILDVALILALAANGWHPRLVYVLAGLMLINWAASYVRYRLEGES